MHNLVYRKLLIFLWEIIVHKHAILLMRNRYVQPNKNTLYAK